MTQHRPPRTRRRGPVRRFFGGMGYLGRGLRLWVTSPRLMLLGAVPALIVGVVYSAAVVLFIVNADPIAARVTPFADDWATVPQAAVRAAAGLALVAALLLIAVLSFAAVTLAVGDPFYERISREVEQRLGEAPAETSESFWRSLRRNLGGTIRLALLTALIGVVLFACGFIPVVGQTVVPLAGALIGGWFLALELSAYAFEARGHPLRSRRRMLGARRADTLGFGLLTYVLFLVPLAAVVIMPAAVAGATILGRDALATAGVAPPIAR